MEIHCLQLVRELFVKTPAQLPSTTTTIGTIKQVLSLHVSSAWTQPHPVLISIFHPLFSGNLQKKLFKYLLLLLFAATPLINEMERTSYVLQKLGRLLSRVTVATTLV